MINIYAKNFYSILLKDGSLYMTGDNDKELLCSDKPEYKKITKISDFENIKHVACGYGCMFIILENGDVYAKGSNKYGQLGLGDKIDRDEFEKIYGLSSVKSISCGATFTFFLLDDGNVMSCGDNDHGQLGIGTDDICVNIPTHVNVSDIIQIECGHSHAIILDSDGNVYATGMNLLGQLGMQYNKYSPSDSISELSSFKKIPNISNVKKIACGASNTYLLLNDNTIMSTGSNLSGQLGLGIDTMYDKYEFTKVENVKNVKDIVAGANTVFAILNDNTLLACGDNTYECLGIQEPPLYVNIFKKVDIHNVEEVACGLYHTLVKTNKKIIGFGDSSHGQLGIDDNFASNHLMCTIMSLDDKSFNTPVLSWLNKDKEYIKKIKIFKDGHYVLDGQKSDNVTLYLVNNMNGKKDAHDISNIRLKITENDLIEKEKWLYVKCNSEDFINIGKNDHVKIESINCQSILSGAANDGCNDENTAKIELYMIPKIDTDATVMKHDFKLILEYDCGEI